jgi:proteic killer suppression protein
MKFGSVRHRGLLNVLRDERPVGVPSAYLDKIQKMLSFLKMIGTIEELRAVPFWRVHQLTGDRKGVFSLTVSRNWRMTFRIDDDQTTILDLDLEDYH